MRLPQMVGIASTDKSDAHTLGYGTHRRVDVMVDPLMSVWDNAPLLPIVTEAGGRFTDLEGNAVVDGGSGLSTNGLLHDAVLAVLRGSKAA